MLYYRQTQRTSNTMATKYHKNRYPFIDSLDSGGGMNGYCGKCLTCVPVSGCGPPDHRPRRAHRRQAQQRERGAQGAAAAPGEAEHDNTMTNDNDECCRIMSSSRSSPTLTGRGSRRELCMPRGPGHSDTSRSGTVKSAIFFVENIQYPLSLKI